MTIKDLGLKLFVVVFLAVFAVFLGVVQDAQAMPDKELNYQGRLTDSNGNVVSDGYYGIRFSIYTSSDATDSVWSETDNVYVRDGIFSTVLGDNSSLDLDFNSSKYYMGLKVGADSEMSPRSQIGAAPFSINSERLNGNEAGTGSNNILQLNSAGEVDIGGAIKTSTYLQAGDGLNVSGGVDFSNATMSSALNMNSHNISSVATLGIQGSNEINFASGSATLMYDGGSFEIESGGDVSISSGTSGRISMGYQIGDILYDVMSVQAAGMDIELPAGTDLDMNVGGSNLFNASNSGFQFERDIDMMTNGLERVQFIEVEDGQYIGSSNASEPRITFDYTASELEISDAGIVIDDDSWIGESATGARLVFDYDGLVKYASFNGINTVNMTATNISDGVTFIPGANNFIGYGLNVDDGRIEFDDSGGNDVITVDKADFIVAENNNYYEADDSGGDSDWSSAEGCPTANTGRAIIVRNITGGGQIDTFDGVQLKNASDGATNTNITNSETVYVVYNGTNWLVIGQGH